jgi:hypothetical protein
MEQRQLRSSLAKLQKQQESSTRHLYLFQMILTSKITAFLEVLMERFIIGKMIQLLGSLMIIIREPFIVLQPD